MSQAFNLLKKIALIFHVLSVWIFPIGLTATLIDMLPLNAMTNATYLSF